MLMNKSLQETLVDDVFEIKMKSQIELVEVKVQKRIVDQVQEEKVEQQFQHDIHDNDVDKN